MTFALDLAQRNDGYLVSSNDTSIIELCRDGLITTRDVGGGYLIARAVHIQTRVHTRYTASRRWEVRANRERAAMAGAVA